MQSKSVEGSNNHSMSEDKKVEVTDAHRAVYCISKMFAALAVSDFITAQHWKEQAEEYADNMVLSSEVIGENTEGETL